MQELENSIAIRCKDPAGTIINCNCRAIEFSNCISIQADQLIAVAGCLNRALVHFDCLGTFKSDGRTITAATCGTAFTNGECAVCEGNVAVDGKLCILFNIKFNVITCNVERTICKSYRIFVNGPLPVPG